MEGLHLAEHRGQILLCGAVPVWGTSDSNWDVPVGEHPQGPHKTKIGDAVCRLLLMTEMVWVHLKTFCCLVEGRRTRTLELWQKTLLRELLSYGEDESIQAGVFRRAHCCLFIYVSCDFSMRALLKLGAKMGTHSPYVSCRDE